MLPPWPPSPAEGPPRGTYFSRRNAMQPLPPSPPFTNILASSTNTGNRLHKIDRAGNEKTVQGSRTAEAKKGGLKSAQNATTQSSGNCSSFAADLAWSAGLTPITRPSPPLSPYFTNPPTIP